MQFRSGSGRELERGVAIAYRGPRSYTGEDMVEAIVHGSPYLVEELVEAFVAAGARPAEPGEFTRRAVANGKMDLIQAEAVRDLVGADSARQAELARNQLAGGLSRAFAALRQELVELLARLEVGLDFPEHEAADDNDLLRRWQSCQKRIGELLESARVGERVRGGVRVVLVGPPNSGKSTLFNRLLGTERAIVTAQPGTTRDLIEAELEVDGARVVLVDTAGLGAPTDPAEREGVRRTRAAAAAAHVVLQLWPADEPDAPPATAGTGPPTVWVRSKADLEPSPGRPHGPRWLPVSCVTDEGVAELRRELRQVVVGEVDPGPSGVAIAPRHRRALERAGAELAAGPVGPAEVAAEAVRWALGEVRALTGEVSSQEVLDEVFRTFCIGK